MRRAPSLHLYPSTLRGYIRRFCDVYHIRIYMHRTKAKREEECYTLGVLQVVQYEWGTEGDNRVVRDWTIHGLQAQLRCLRNMWETARSITSLCVLSVCHL